MMDGTMHRFFIFLLSATIVVLQDPPSGCLKEEFSCNDGKCIPDHFLCNGITDCSNGLDEFVCIDRIGLGCPANDRQCGENPNECVALVQVCDGINDCQNGEDESSCSLRPNSTCLISEFECPFLGGILTNETQIDCIPLAYQCDGNADCTDSGDEFGCSPPIIIVEPIPSINVHHGSSPSLTCIAEGTPTPTVTWYKNLQPLNADPRYVVVSEDGMGVLLIKNATLFDQAQYSCIATNSFQTSVISSNRTDLKIFNTSPFVCNDVNGNQYTEGDYYYNKQTLTFGNATTAVADIVFVVDESGSMTDAHEWIRMVVPLLDESLRNEGIGIGLRNNLFALVGFGRNMIPEGEGIVLANLTSIEDFLNASHNLATDGLYEDGYSGIEVALDQVSLRDDSTRIMILVSNEARQPFIGKDDLTRNIIGQRLIDSRFVLNSIVSQAIIYDKNDNTSFAFALEANGTAYSFTSLSSYKESSNGLPHPDPSFSAGATYEDYTRLALDLGGAVFDINQIQNGGSLLVPFLDVFIKVKVKEVTGFINRCLNCLCVGPSEQCEIQFGVDINNCTGPAPPESFITVAVFPTAPEVVEGTNLTLICETVVSPPDSDIEIVWMFMNVINICDSDRVECFDNKAIIINFRAEDQGFYSCEASTSSTTGFGLTMATVISSPMASLTTNKPEVNVGKPIIFTCSATGLPIPSIIWRKSSGQQISNTQDRVFIDTSVSGNEITSEFVIDPANVEDAGSYECVAINRAGTDVVNATVNVLLTECTIDGSTITVDDSKIVFITNEETHSADIILVIDESGSMENEHEWIINMTRRLDEILQELGIGKNVSNMFGITGFGSFNKDYTNGRVISYNDMSFLEANEVDKLISMLQVSGRREDGYLALKVAIESYEFRSNAVKQFILITDEERDVVDTRLNKTGILNLLSDSQLSGVVSEGFETFDGIPAIGIDSNGNGYIYDPDSPNFVRLSVGGARPIKDSGYASTNDDYTDLVLLSGGSIWDLLLLRQGGQVAEAFTEAFVQATIEGIYRRLSTCMNCTCTANNGLSCIRLTDYDDIPECNITQVLMAVLRNMSKPSSSISVRVTPSIQRHLNGQGIAELVCSIDNGTEGQFVWTLNGGRLFTRNIEVSSTTVMSILRIVPVLQEHNGRYTCLVRRDDAIGSDTGFIEINELQSPLGVMVLEPEMTIVEGQNVSFNCSSSEEQVIFSWNYNQGLPLPNNAIVENYPDTSVLTITNARVSNIGRYFCVGKRNMSLVTDRDFTKLYVYTPLLRISVDTPTSVITDVGSNVTLTCKVDCFCPGAVLSWRRGINSTLPDNAQVIYNSDQTQALLQFSNVISDNCDLYACVGEFGDQTVIIQAQLLIRELEAFEVMLNTNSSLIVVADANQTFICSSNSEISEWRWLFNNDTNLPDSVEVFNLTNSNRTVLVICGVQEFHAGAYECEGVNINDDTASDISQLQVIANNDSEVISTSSQDMKEASSSINNISVTVTSTMMTIDSGSLSSSGESFIESESIVSTMSSSTPSMSSDTMSISSTTSDTVPSLSISSTTSDTVPSLSISSTTSDTVPSPSISSVSSDTVRSSSMSRHTVPSPSISSVNSNTVPSPSISSVSSDTVPSPSISSVSSDTVPSPSISSVSSNTVPSPSISSVSSDTVPSPSISSVSSDTVSSPSISSMSSDTVPSPSISSVSSDTVSSPSISSMSSDTMPSPSISSVSSDTVSSPSISSMSSDTVPSPSISSVSSDTVSSPSISSMSSDTMPSPSISSVSSDTVSSPSISSMSSDTVPSPSISSVSSDTVRSSSMSSDTVPSPGPSPPPLMTPDVSLNQLNLSPGENASITCTSNTAARLIWSFGTSNSLPNNVKFVQTSAKTAVIMIINFDSNLNEGSYSCLAQAGGIERGVAVPVNAIEMLDITLSQNSFTTIPSDAPEEVNKVKVICKLNCECGRATIEWTFGPNREPLPNGVMATYDFSQRVTTLVFDVVTFELAGNYICIAKLNTDTAQGNFTLDVLEPAMVTVIPSQISVDAGESVTLVCVSNRDATFVWTYETISRALPPSATFERINSTASRLMITNVANSNDNTGQFFCQGLFARTFESRSNTGNVVQTTELRIRLTPTSNDNIYYFTVGDTIAIDCRVNCPCGGATSEWSESTILPQGLRSVPRSISNRVQRLSSSSAELNHNGEYDCRVFNSEESITETIQIIVT